MTKSSEELSISLQTEENCLSSSRIRDFLLLSRVVDDTIKQHLNEESEEHCGKYFETKIIPEWKARVSVIQFCSNYALNLKEKTAKEAIVCDDDAIGNESFNLRLDPYAWKNYKENIESQFLQCETIENWVKNEKFIESIIQEQTIGVLNDKCGYRNWMKEFKKFMS